MNHFEITPIFQYNFFATKCTKMIHKGLIRDSKAGYPVLSVISNLFFQKAAGNFVFRLPGAVVA